MAYDLVARLYRAPEDELYFSAPKLKKLIDRHWQDVIEGLSDELPKEAVIRFVDLLRHGE